MLSTTSISIAVLLALSAGQSYSYSGTGACPAGQYVSTLNRAAAPSCVPVTSSQWTNGNDGGITYPGPGQPAPVFAVGNDGTINTPSICFGFGNDAGCQTSPATSNISCTPGTILLDGGGVDWSCASRHAAQGIEAVFPHDQYDVLVYHLNESAAKGSCDGGPCICGAGGYCQMPILQNAGNGDPSDAGVPPDSSYALYYTFSSGSLNPDTFASGGITDATALRMASESSRYTSLGPIGMPGTHCTTLSYWVKTNPLIGYAYSAYWPNQVAVVGFDVYTDRATDSHTLNLGGIATSQSYSALVGLNISSTWWAGLPQNEWLLIGVVWDTTQSPFTVYWYVGSQLTGTVDLVATYNVGTTRPLTRNPAVIIGSVGGGGAFYGSYNEIRVANIPRSQAWFTSYWKAIMHQGLE